MRTTKSRSEKLMENDDFKTEVRNGFRRLEQNSQELEKLARSDHDLLIRLNEQFTEGFATLSSGAGRIDSRVDDHERRIRFLERVAFGLLAVIILLQFVVGKFLK